MHQLKSCLRVLSVPVPALSLKFKRFRRRFGVTAPRVVIREHVSWYRWALLVVLSFLTGWTGAVILRGDTELKGVRESLAAQREELLVLRSVVGTERNEASLERASQRQLVDRMARLEMDNSLLKEDLLAYEKLLSAGFDGTLIKIEVFRLLPEAAGRVRFRFLLVSQKMGGEQQFRYQVYFKTKGGDVVRRYPVQPELIKVGRVLRIEESVDVPEGEPLQAAELRVWLGERLLVKRETLI